MFCSVCCPPSKAAEKNDASTLTEDEEEDDVPIPSWFTYVDKGGKANGEINPVIFKEESYVKVSIEKPTADALLGIRYQQSKSNSWRIVVTHVVPNGLAAQTGKLQVGQTILSVNGTSCSEWESARDLTTFLRSIPKRVTIVATKSVTATVHKATADTKVGIAYGNAEHVGSSTGEKDAVFIHLLTPKGLFHLTGILQVGMRVVAINGEPCPNSVAEALCITKESVGYLSIVAVPEHLNFLTTRMSAGSTSQASISSLSDGAPDEWR